MFAAGSNRVWAAWAFADRLVLATLCFLAPFAQGSAESSVNAERFQARSGPRSATLFSEISAETSGIRIANPYDDPRMWRERYHEFGVGAIGTGVAIGDFDGDGLADVFVVSKLVSCRLFRNLGNWEFEDVTDQAGVGDASREWKQGASFVDIDNDGLLDIYLCRFDAPNLLFVNQGDGTFREEAEVRGLAVVDSSGMAAFEDYDRDGWLDLYLQTNLLSAAGKPDGQSDYLFRNKGDGTFVDVTEASGVKNQTQGHSVTWWDYDEDGWPDIYVANDFAAPDYLYRNRGDGTFHEVIGQVVPHAPYSSMGSDIGDINNDGHIDLLATDMANTTHEKDQRGMADSRANVTETEAGSPSVAMQIPRNALYLNTGLGRCLETAYLSGVAATDWTWSVRFEDLDNDGFVDLHVTNGMNREQNNVDLIVRMLRSESAYGRVGAMRSAPVLEEENLAYRNRGDLRFEEVGAKWGLDHRGVSFGASFGDLDNDGDLDLVFTNFEKGPTVLRNDSDSGNRVTIALRGDASNRYGIGAVVQVESSLGTQTRRLTLARGYLSTSEPIVHFGLGTDERIDRLSIQWPSGRVQELRDLPANQAYTIAEPEADSDASQPEAARRPQFSEVAESVGLAVSVPEEKREGTVSQPLLPTRFNRRGPGVAVADLNRDGSEEIVLGGTTQQAARVLRRAGDGYQVESGQSALSKWPINDGPPLIFDANADGFNDLLLTSGGAVFEAEEPEYEARLFLNDGKGNLRPAPKGALPSLPTSAGAATTADFDRDGRLDLFIGGRVAPGYYPEAPFSGLFANKGGRFVDVTDELAPDLREIGMVTSALWSDADQDGWPDLLLALDWGGVRYFRNQEGEGFEDRSEEAGFSTAGSGWWNSLVSADFNDDGVPDYVAGNLGLNTQFRASSEQPELLFYGDFAKTRTPQIVRAYHEEGRLLPRASRRELGARIPSVLEKFPSNNAYAAATLEEILDPAQLAAATRLEVSELRSGVFLSQADAGFTFSPLPIQAQVAPIQGMAVADFDGDGHLDILATHNDYSPMPSIGRFDGGLGLWLRGDGQGGFAAVPADESGVIIPGDAKALVALDVNGDRWPDTFVTRNNASSLAFQNQGRPDRHPLTIVLKGAAGNPSGIGARVDLQMRDGSIQWREVQAGGGWASQSSPTLFFGYSDENPPIKARVRWPTGERVEYEAKSNVLVLKQE